MAKGEHITESLLLCWLKNIFSASFRYQPYPADGKLSAFVVIFIISLSIISSSGLDIKKYQHSSRLWPKSTLYEAAASYN
ncbi:MAG: hypothetical protein JST63_18145 [Bacteroidetes bacterium]|nr:hypothetical protein [Bacteroidota bacterium]